MEILEGAFKGRGIVLWILQQSILILVVLVFSYYWRIYFSRVGRLLNKFPGTIPLPFIGNSLPFANADEMPKNLTKLLKKYKKTFRVWMLSQPLIVTSDVNVIQAVLSSQKHVEKGESYKETHFLMGQGLVTSPPLKWRKDRKELKPSLRSQLEPNFICSFNKNAEILTKILGEKFATEKTDLEIRPEIGRCTIDIINETVLDTTINAQLQPELGYYETSVKGIDLIRIKMFEPWKKIPIIWKLSGHQKIEEETLDKLHNLYYPISQIEDKKREHLKSLELGEFDENSRTFIHMLLESNRDLTDVLYHVISIFGAGFDTTSTVLNFALYSLAINLKEQVKVQEELDLVFGSIELNGNVTLEQVKKLKYLDLVIKESMRFFPPATFLMRKLECDEPLGNGLTLPKDSNVLILPWNVHHDPGNYPEPEKFIPERFLSENSGGRSAYAYLPFSAGPRNCMGQKYAMIEMKVILAHILKKFNVSTNQKLKDLVLHYGVVLEAKHGLKLRLTLRSDPY